MIDKKTSRLSQTTSDVFEDLRGERLAGPAFKELSMGMSADFETAIEAGATMVRIGSALFEGLGSAASHPAATGEGA